MDPEKDGDPTPQGELPDLPPDEIIELAEAARQYVISALGVELDYSPETLPVLDHYLGTVRENARDRPELMELVTRSAGAYFGEVVRRTMPAFWYASETVVRGWQICFEEMYLAFDPMAFAWDAIYQSSDHDGPSSELVLDREDGEALERRLAELPPVSEDEYWMLATRFEVIEIAADQLKLELKRAGLEKVSYGPADYSVVGRPIGEA